MNLDRRTHFDMAQHVQIRHFPKFAAFESESAPFSVSGYFRIVASNYWLASSLESLYTHYYLPCPELECSNELLLTAEFS